MESSTMFSIKDIQIETPTLSPLNPVQLQFTENTVKKTWDLIETNDTVGIILFNSSSKTLIALKKFEPAVYVARILKDDRKSTIDMNKYTEDLGVVIELCRCNLKKDENMCMLHRVRLAILEKTGYDVSEDSLEFVSSFKSDVGPKCGEISIYYCEVNSKMKVEGCQKRSELVVEMGVTEVREYIQKSLPLMRSSPIFLYAMLWFMREKDK